MIDDGGSQVTPKHFNHIIFQAITQSSSDECLVNFLSDLETADILHLQ